jgi:hypothetical protein
LVVGDFVTYYKNVIAVYQYFQPAAGNVFLIMSFGGSHNAEIGIHNAALGVDDTCMGTGVFNGLMSAFGVESGVVNTKIIISNSDYLNSYTTGPAGGGKVHACMVQTQ